MNDKSLRLRLLRYIKIADPAKQDCKKIKKDRLDPEV